MTGQLRYTCTAYSYQTIRVLCVCWSWNLCLRINNLPTWGKYFKRNWNGLSSVRGLSHSFQSIVNASWAGLHYLTTLPVARRRETQATGNQLTLFSITWSLFCKFVGMLSAASIQFPSEELWATGNVQLVGWWFASFSNTGFSSLYKKNIRTVLIMVCNTAKSSWLGSPQQLQRLFAPPGVARRSPSLLMTTNIVNRCLFVFLFFLMHTFQHHLHN